MRRLALVVFLGLSFVGIVAVGSPGQTTRNKHELALEGQIACKEVPRPMATITALQRAGYISRSPFVVVDSINFFRVKRPMEIFGLPVVSVAGFDYHPRMFRVSPGTLPGTLLGVVVPRSVAKVRSTLAGKANLESMWVNQSMDIVPIRNDRTKVVCLADKARP